MEPENCKCSQYRKEVARLLDVHIDCMDCWKADCPYMKKHVELHNSLLKTKSE